MELPPDLGNVPPRGLAERFLHSAQRHNPANPTLSRFSRENAARLAGYQSLRDYIQHWGARNFSDLQKRGYKIPPEALKRNQNIRGILESMGVEL